MSDPNNEENKILVDKEELASLAKEASDKENIAAELREVRSKKNSEIEELKKKLEGVDTEGKIDIDSKITEVLTKKEQEQIDREREEALLEFRENHAEFSKDNDPGDLKYKAFERELKKFNFNDVRSKSEMESRLREVYEFANRKNINKDTSNISPYAFQKKPSGSYNEVDADSLSDKEKKLIKTYGFTEQYYLEQKNKRPSYINNLLKFMN